MPTPIEISQSLGAILIFLLSAHLGGFLFQKIRQPIVIGEILGGLILGPSVFGYFAPELFNTIFIAPERARLALSLIYNFGLLLLMFLSGLESESLFAKGQRRSAWTLALFGTLVPLGIGFGLSRAFELREFIGSNGSPESLAIVLGCAAAVTSLPVISRIFMDLGILRSAFARLVLTAALIDDVILYVLMALVLTVSHIDHNTNLGLLQPLLAPLSLETRVVSIALLHLGFILFTIGVGRPAVAWLVSRPLAYMMVRSPVSLYIVILLTFSILGFFLSVPFVLSSFCGGIAASGARGFRESEHETLKTFSMSFFIPIYFAYVGFRIDLARDFHVIFTFGLILLASVIKMSSIWIAARVSKVPPTARLDLAVTMNARGGPGIILASVAFDAQIITPPMFVTLVSLAILTSLGAGSWLQRRLDKGKLNYDLN